MGDEIEEEVEEMIRRSLIFFCFNAMEREVGIVGRFDFCISNSRHFWGEKEGFAKWGTSLCLFFLFFFF